MHSGPFFFELKNALRNSRKRENRNVRYILIHRLVKVRSLESTQTFWFAAALQVIDPSPTWRNWGLNPESSACKVNVLLLSYGTPLVCHGIHRNQVPQASLWTAPSSLLKWRLPSSCWRWGWMVRICFQPQALFDLHGCNRAVSSEGLRFKQVVEAPPASRSKFPRALSLFRHHVDRHRESSFFTYPPPN